MIKAFFLDFYGTVVFEDGEMIDEVSQTIYETGSAENKGEIGRFWWSEFQRMCSEAFGPDFETQRELEHRALENTIRYFRSAADAGELSGKLFAYWRKPPVFADSREFFRRSPVPIYMVSNIDRQDILAALAYHQLAPADIFTSEDARAYKPREELFRLALRSTGLEPGEVVHIGDSIGSDVKGASLLGIRALWLNRSGKAVPEGIVSISSLLDGMGFL